MSIVMSASPPGTISGAVTSETIKPAALTLAANINTEITKQTIAIFIELEYIVCLKTFLLLKICINFRGKTEKV